MDIPYTVKPRPDTGLYNAKVGIWLFLASEVMLFGAFFSAYILLRVGAPEGFWPDIATGWPHGLLNIPIGTFNTAVLIASSVTVVMAWTALKEGNYPKFQKFMAFTVACALGFLSIKTYEYNEKFTHYVIRLKDGSAVTGHLEHNYIQGFLAKANERRSKENAGIAEENKKLKAEKKPEKAEISYLSHRFLTLAAFTEEESRGTKEAEEIKVEADIPNKFRFPVGFKVPEKIHEAQKAGIRHEEREIKLSEIASLKAFIPSTATFFAIYFTMTFLHGLHVLIGALVLGYFAFFSRKFWQQNPEQFTNRIEVAGLFWHFVDLVWIFLFPVVYLL